MKRIIFVLMMLMMVMSTAEAAKSGDRIARADYTDMSVYINHYPIESYMVGGYAVIPAEELANYCCDVVWSEADWALYITKSETKQEFTAPMVYRSSRPGKFYSDVYKTDIRCIINGTEVPTFNINGRIFITIDDFGLCMDEYTWADWAYAAKAWLNGKPIKEYKSIPFGTDLLFLSDSTDDPLNWSGVHDLNYDGIKENIRVSVSRNDGSIEVNVGGRKKSFGWAVSIKAVYVCDIDSSDGVMDLAIMFSNDHACSDLYVIKYDKNLSVYDFLQFSEIYNVLYLGPYEPYFRVIDDNTIIIKKMTCSQGMWPIFATYKLDRYGMIFNEVKSSYYEILPEFMSYNTWKELSQYESEMWDKGYIKAYKTYYDSIPIYKGEYFKVLYDDGNNYLFIVKENGQAGWISIPYNSGWGLRDLNPHFFIMGG